MPEIKIESAGLRAAAKRLAKARQDLGLYSKDVAANFMLKVDEGLVALYGPELGRPEEYWHVEWTGGTPGEGGTLGLLTVQSDHPYVMGYEFGTPEHEIWARMAPGRPGGPGADGPGQKALSFFWEKEGVSFVGQMVNHPGAKAHHFLPYLEVYLREVGRYGWSSAVRAALAGEPYQGVIPVTPPHMYQPTTNDDARGR